MDFHKDCLEYKDCNFETFRFHIDYFADTDCIDFALRGYAVESDMDCMAAGHMVADCIVVDIAVRMVLDRKVLVGMDSVDMDFADMDFADHKALVRKVLDHILRNLVVAAVVTYSSWL